MRFLVLGGAGYVGSHFVKAAQTAGHTCIVYDNLERGHRQAVEPGVELIVGDIRDGAAFAAAVRQANPDVVLHYAAYALVAESVRDPQMYQANNVDGTRNVLQVLRDVGAVPVVFSSTCAVYGTPPGLPIAEDCPKKPQSPYGESKLACEGLLQEYVADSGTGAMALRYFNACGAAADGSIGEDHEPETHLIPNVFRAALGQTRLTVFGTDFPTRDGTCVRDYVHVDDLAAAHLAAAQRLQGEGRGQFQACNLGTGAGYSNLEIVKAAETASGKAIAYDLGDRRPGDPAELFADNSLARSLLGFEPQRSSLATILASAWQWHSSHPDGYRSRS